ncbi:phage tail assembly chaperone [Glacieibacterium frigidum]|uniref:Phage tail assembly chaperone n=1 Tax=Glacieibacterium frigidum TaxID=2593303 RepID=A0A552U854_9SPHN|nr:phage tail assembly chaperone [Glacieibacterium frigidum]TRW14359.1 phage tail assembly chaperone [Glacieibacterium frigidum]
MGADFASAAARAAHIAQGLGWTPDIFWAATPADLRLALGPPPETPGDGDVLRRLMEAYPDG